MEMLNSARTLSEAYFGPPLSVPCLEFQPSVLSEVMTWRSSSMRASIILSSTIAGGPGWLGDIIDRKSTRLNSSHGYISYAVFCLKKKNTTQDTSHGYISYAVFCLHKRTPIHASLAHLHTSLEYHALQTDNVLMLAYTLSVIAPIH